ncbi:MAG: rhodanese-like domain-containing protein [Bacteroidota bacterium]
METIDAKELKKRLDAKDVTLIEVLSEEKYKEKHIKGAINIPLEKIATEANKKFEKDDPIVVYCSDKDCTSSPTAAKKLKASGFNNVYYFEGGKKAWEDAGYPMESN